MDSANATDSKVESLGAYLELAGQFQSASTYRELVPGGVSDD
jgi:hypothetical protein